MIAPMKNTPGTGAPATKADHADSNNNNSTNHSSATATATAFIARWSGITASELATAQSVFIELCALLGVAPRTHEHPPSAMCPQTGC
jgi:hypothetical protein